MQSNLKIFSPGKRVASDQHICKAVDKLVQVTPRKLMTKRISPGIEVNLKLWPSQFRYEQHGTALQSRFLGDIGIINSELKKGHPDSLVVHS